MLKKIIVVASLICAFSINGMAQKTFFGIKSGLNLSSMRTSGLQTDAFQTTKSYVGYNFSGWFGYKFSKKIRMSFEPGYVVKGSAFEGSTERLKLKYIDLPVLVEYEVLKDVNLLAGPSFAYQLGAKRITDDGSINVSDIYNESSEISGILGVSFNVSFFMDIGARYNYGFTKASETVLTNDIGVETGRIKEYNRYLQFLIRFKIAN